MKIKNISEGHWEVAPEKYPGSILPKERKAKRHGILAYPDDRQRFMKNMGLSEDINEIQYDGETKEHRLEDCRTKDFDEEKWKKIKLDEPPLNNSEQTQQELDQIVTLISNISKSEREEIQAQDKDDLEDLFFDILDDHNIKYDKRLHKHIEDITEQLVTICLHFKKIYNRARPKQLLSKQDAKKVIGGKTAKSASYPSAHAVIGKVLSGIFSKLYPELSYEFDELGTSLGYNRIKAGYHFKSDYEAGIKIAKALLNDNLNAIIQKAKNPSQISEAVVGKSKEELDLIARIIWNTARKYRGKPNAILNFEIDVNHSLLPYRIKFDQHNKDLRDLRMPAKVERADDGVIAVILTPPIGSLMNNIQHIMMLISHELVHVDQLNRAEARRPGSIDIMYKNYEKRIMKNGKVDKEAYASDRHELMAYARSTVDALKMRGLSKEEIIEMLRTDDIINVVGPPTINELDKRRKLRYAIAYAQQLDEGSKRLNESYADHVASRRSTGFWGAKGAGSIVLASNTGRILLPHRSKSVLEPNTWGVWGGAIDSSEDPEVAAKRELQEEAGYNGNIEMVPLSVYQRGTFYYHNFLAIVEEEFIPNLDWETQNYTWTTLDKLPKPLHYGLKWLLERDGEKIQSIIDQHGT